MTPEATAGDPHAAPFERLTATMPKRISYALGRLSYWPISDDTILLLQDTWERVSAVLHEQDEANREAIFENLCEMAETLTELDADVLTLAVGLLEPVVHRLEEPVEQARRLYGETGAAVLKGVIQLEGVVFDPPRDIDGRQPEYFRRLLLALTPDLRSLLILLARRLIEMRHVSRLPRPQQLKQARAALDVYAPLAHRLGIGRFKWELEDLAFQTLDPDTYTHYAELVAAEALGDVTANVDSFLANRHPGYRWREDYILSGRRRVEYHLALVGAEILNRAFREAFHRRSHKLVILPGCMRKLPEKHCKAIRNGMDQTCSGCTPKCRVNQVTQLGKWEGFETRIVSHASSFTHWLKENAAGQDIGVVGVACAMHLIFGGLKMKGLDIAAQCVFLDYCGCNSHWHKEGIPTDLNDNQLLRIVQGPARTRIVA